MSPLRLRRLIHRWRQRPLHVQLALLGSMVIALTLGIDTYLTTTAQTRNAFEKIQSAAIALTRNIAITGAYQIIDDDLASLEDLLLKSAQFPDVLGIQVYDARGRSLSSVRTAPGHGIMVEYDQITQHVPVFLADGDPTIVERQGDKLLVSHSINSYQPIGWVVVTYDLTSLDQIQTALWVDNSFMAAAAILIDVLILLLILRPQTATLRLATAFASRLKRQTGEVMKLPATSTEIGELVTALNDTSVQLKSQRDEILRSRARTEDVIKELEATKSSLEKRVDERTQQITWQATHDALTGLINRFEFEKTLTRLLETAKNGREKHVLCFLDLDKFKVVNDTSGHVAGDALLKQLGALLADTEQGRAIVARLGGDEFAVLLENCTLAQGEITARNILNAVRNFRFTWQDKAFTIGVSIGLAAIDGSNQSITDILTTADIACYVAKERGRNGIHIHHATDHDLVQRRIEVSWIEHLHQAMNENRFCLFRQPIFPLDVASDSPSQCEILLRLRDDHGNIVRPNSFLPTAEQFNLLGAIDRWVIDQVFQLYAQYGNCADGTARPSLCAINLSGASLSDEASLAYIKRKLTEYRVPPQSFCFEITETEVISNLPSATRLIKELKALGCRFSLDDFGTGLASLSYLKALPVDYIKIDGSFIQNMLRDPVDRAIVHAVNDLAHAIGLKTIAEYVEEPAVVDALREIGVDFAQGTAIAPLEPVPTPNRGDSLLKAFGPPPHSALLPYIGNVLR